MIDYLQKIAAFRSTIQLDPSFQYTGVEDYVLDRGRTQTVATKLTEEELEILYDAIDLSGMLRPRKKQCFYNAQLLALGSYGKIEYVEGIAIGRSGVYAHHGWNKIGDKLIDLTWRTTKQNHRGRLRNRIFGKIPEGWQYRGIAFRDELIRQRISDTQMVCAVIADWRYSFVLLKQVRL